MLSRCFLAAALAVALLPAIADACHRPGLAARVHANREAVRDARHAPAACGPAVAVVVAAPAKAVQAAPKPAVAAVAVSVNAGACADGSCGRRGVLVRVFARFR